MRWKEWKKSIPPRSFKQQATRMVGANYGEEAYWGRGKVEVGVGEEWGEEGRVLVLENPMHRRVRKRWPDLGFCMYFLTFLDAQLFDAGYGLHCPTHISTSSNIFHFPTYITMSPNIKPFPDTTWGREISSHQLERIFFWRRHLATTKFLRCQNNHGQDIRWCSINCVAKIILLLTQLAMYL